MALANQEAQRFSHECIGTEHILLGLLKEGSGVGANVLKTLGVDLRKVRLEVEKLVKSGPETVTMAKLPQTPRAKRVIEYAIDEARNLNHNYVGTEHLLLGLLREQDGVAAQVLMNLGLQLADVRDEVIQLLGASPEAGYAGGDAGTAPLAAGGAGDGTGYLAFEELLKNDAAGSLALKLLDELTRRRDAAVVKAEYEEAAQFRDLMAEVRAILNRLSAILREESPPGPHAEAP